MLDEALRANKNYFIIFKTTHYSFSFLNDEVQKG